MVGMQSVLFCSNTAHPRRPFVDPSTRYRTYYLAQELSRRGFRSHVTSQAHFQRDTDIAKQYDKIVFHRPSFNEQTARYFMRESPNRIIADFDDLIFSPTHAALTPMARSRDTEVIQQMLARHADAIKYVGACTASTVPLRDGLVEQTGLPADKVQVISNAVDPAFVHLSRAARRRRTAARPFKIGYFPGTATHDLDVQIAAEAVVQLLSSSPRARMLVVGPLKLPTQWHRYSDRIEQRPLVSFTQLPFTMAEVETVSLRSKTRNSIGQRAV